MKNLPRSPLAIAAFVALMFAVGCRSARPSMNAETADTITQVGLLSGLSDGGSRGFYAVTNLPTLGDHGFGLFDHGNGELVIYSGTVFCARGGRIIDAPVSNSTPYAVITFFNPDRIFDVDRMDMKLFGRALDMRRRLKDVPEAIQVSGYFSRIVIDPSTFPGTSRSPGGRVTVTNVTGAMIGYFYPKGLSGLLPSGYHLQFIDSNGAVGGPVVDFSIRNARISVDQSPYLNVVLNTTETPAPIEKAMVPINAEP